MFKVDSMDIHEGSITYELTYDNGEVQTYTQRDYPSDILEYIRNYPERNIEYLERLSAIYNCNIVDIDTRWILPEFQALIKDLESRQG